MKNLINSYISHCDNNGKISYMTYEEAKYEADRMTRVTKELFNYYKCKYCHYFHIGHTRKISEDKLLNKESRHNMKSIVNLNSNYGNKFYIVS